MQNSIFRMFLAAALFAVSTAAALAGDVVLTPFGQSPDAMMVRVVLKKLGIDGRLDKLLEADGLQGEQVLITVVAGSSKGLGEAGIDKDAVIARMKSVVAAARGDYDGLFTRLAGEAGVEMIPAPSVRETSEPLEAILTEWGVLP